MTATRPHLHALILTVVLLTILLVTCVGASVLGVDEPGDVALILAEE